jgi:hypothetical protein
MQRLIFPCSCAELATSGAAVLNKKRRDLYNYVKTENAVESKFNQKLSYK